MSVPRIFILSYQGIKALSKWFDPDNFSIPVHIIDNGRQDIPEHIKPYVLHTTEENIFCAGGLNLCARIGFDYFKSEKIILTQDDAKFNSDQVHKVLDLCAPDVISGGRNDLFFYCFLGMHNNIFKTVGPFDENYLYGTCEDNDYYYRATLQKVKHITANLKIDNLNISSPAVSWKYGNYEYLISKWGPHTKGWSMYSYNKPFNNSLYEKYRPEYWTHFKTKHTDFMSDYEYQRFIKDR